MDNELTRPLIDGENLVNIKILPSFIAALLMVLSSAVAATKATQKSVPHFYQLKRGDKVIYLLGTFHAGVSIADYPAQILDHFDQSKVVFFEKAFTVSDVESLNQNPQAFYIKHLKEDYSPSTTLEVSTRQKLLSYGLPAEVVEYVDNENCSIFLYARFILKNPPLDFELLGRAYKNKQSIRELDKGDLREQAANFKDQQQPQGEDQNSTCNLNQFFKEYSAEQIHLYEHNRIQEYLSGDENTIYKAEDSYDPSSAYRNKEWVESIKNENEKGPYFIAVGAYHLYSDQGLISLLQKLGFEVKRLSF